MEDSDHRYHNTDFYGQKRASIEERLTFRINARRRFIDNYKAEDHLDRVCIRGYNRCQAPDEHPKHEI